MIVGNANTTARPVSFLEREKSKAAQAGRIQGMLPQHCEIYNSFEAQIENLRCLCEDLREAKAAIDRLTSPDEIRNLDDALRSAQLAEQELQTKASDHAISCTVCKLKFSLQPHFSQ